MMSKPDDLEEEQTEMEALQSRYDCPKVLLTAQEEQQFCQLAQEGNAAAQEKMVQHNLRLVIKIARQYRMAHMEFEDLVQEGIIGLLTAIRKFDNARKCRFSTYATWWIRQAITRAIAKHSRNIRIPDHLWHKQRKFEATRHKLSLELGYDPSVEELCDYLEMPETTGRRIEAIPEDPLSLDFSDHEIENTLYGDKIPDKDAPDPETAALQSSQREEILALFSHLNTREQYVMYRRFGFFDGDYWPLQEIGNHLNLTRETIRQIEANAIKKLKAIVKVNGITF